MTDTPPPETTGKAAPCPLCGKPAAAKFRPFCSSRCADLDLHRWLGGVYRIESDDPPSPTGEESD